MSTEITTLNSGSSEVTTMTEAEIRKLAESVGADPNADRGPSVPMLKINMDDEDKDGHELPRGHMFLTGMDEPVYAKTVTIRPLMQHYQYQHFDSKEKKNVNRTIQMKSFQEEPIDQLGGVRCGRPGGDKWKNMDKEEKKKYEDITAFRLVRCLVSYTGKTKTGEEVTIANAPAIIRLKGANFMPFDEEFAKALPRGKTLWDFNVEVSLERQKNGSVVYFVMHFDADFANPLPLDVRTLETINHFAGMVENDNDRIRSAHNSAVNKRQSDDSAYDAISGSLEDDVEDED